MRFSPIIAASLLLVSSVFADIHYVRTNSLTPVAPYLDWSTAATNIQDAIDVALAGDTVVVSNGVYATRGRAVFNAMTNRIVITNAITVVSLNGPQVTTLMGAIDTRGAYVGSNAVLSGFTVTKGRARNTGDVIKERSGAGIWCEPGGTVVNCIVLSNLTVFGEIYLGGGGGIYGGVISNCIVMGNSSGSGGGISALAVVWNSVIASNYANTGGGAQGCYLNNCLVISNAALYYNGQPGWGGGAAFCISTNCTFTKGYTDPSGSGGGTYRGTNFGCVITENFGANGGGVHSSTNFNCRITRNRGGGLGGGAYISTLYNCIISGNSVTSSTPTTWNGGGAYGSRLLNCTVVSNSAASNGGGTYGSDTFNSVIYYNSAPISPNVGSPASIVYGCCMPSIGFQIGGTTNAPMFVDVAGEDFRLKCGSPGVDLAYTNGPLIITTAIDFNGQPRPVDGDGDSVARVDIGAHEFDPATGQTVSIRRAFNYTNIAINFPVGFYAQLGGCESVSWWDFGDGTTVTNQLSVRHEWTAEGTYDVRLFAYYPALGQTVSATTQVQVVYSPVYYVNGANPTPVFPYTNWATAALHIQQAIGASSLPGRLVLVTNGFYQGLFPGVIVYGTHPNSIALTNAVHVKSLNGPDGTYILPGWGRGAYIGKDSVLDGFRVWRCHAGSGNVIFDQSGGGLWCEPDGVATNCFIYENTATYQGGGAYQGKFYNCTFSNNTISTSLSFAGGGGTAFPVLRDCLVISNRITSAFPGCKGGGSYGGELYNCTLCGNRAENGDLTGTGGGAFLSTLSNCVIAANFGSGYGGGGSSNLLLNCLITGNEANYGGGAYNSTVINCVVISNTAYANGGGIYCVGGAGLFYNSTIVRNRAANGGGVYFSFAGSAWNSIVYHNFTSGSGTNYAGAPFNAFACCTTPIPLASGQWGTITNEPSFVDLDAGDVRLRVGSVGVDGGTNVSYVTVKDFFGTARPLDGDGNGVLKFDMGAYELDLWAAVGTNWLTGFGLDPNDPLIFASDPDGDGMTTLQEWIAGTEPNNASSALKMLSAVPDVGGVTVTWQSVAGKTYFVQRRDDTISGTPFVTVQTGIPGQSGTTSYTDSTAAADGTYFYRVGVAP